MNTELGVHKFHNTAYLS